MDNGVGDREGFMANVADDVDWTVMGTHPLGGRYRTKADFIGHIGGDDFVMITSPSRAEFMAKYIIDEFDKGAMLLLNEADVKRGYLEVRDRQGELKRIPVMSVTMALVISTDNNIEHFAQISDIATSLKEYGKRIKGSVVVKERRQDGVTQPNDIKMK